jgi:hypothetical protein
MSGGADNIFLELKIHNNPQIIHRIHENTMFAGADAS